MNYINKLQAENEILRESLAAADERIVEILAYFATEKFKGCDFDGSRKDWVSTSEANQLLGQIRDIVRNGQFEASNV